MKNLGQFNLGTNKKKKITMVVIHTRTSLSSFIEAAFNHTQKKKMLIVHLVSQFVRNYMPVENHLQLN